MRTKEIKGQKYYLKANAEVKRVMHNAKITAKQDMRNQVVYEDEPGSVAYCRSCLFGAWDYQKEENIIAKIEVVYE